MAPEVILGDTDVDRRADVYALGCVAYYLLTGQLVFEAETPMKMLMHHVQTRPVPPSQRTELRIPRELDELVMSCLEKDPNKRPQNAEELSPAGVRVHRVRNLEPGGGQPLVADTLARSDRTAVGRGSRERSQSRNGGNLMSIQAAVAEKSWLDRSLSVFTEVRAGEGVSALLLAANVFYLLAFYSVLKIVRDALILSESGAVAASYASAGQALLLLVFVPAYSAFASRVNRVWLVCGVTLFFASHLIIFYLIGSSGVRIGIAFYLWIGVFSMVVVAQFWAFANDLYTTERGKRLFPILGHGRQSRRLRRRRHSPRSCSAGSVRIR